MGEAIASEVPARRDLPAFGDAGPPPEVEAKKEAHAALDRRTEALGRRRDRCSRRRRVRCARVWRLQRGERDLSVGSISVAHVEGAV
jgi:hypothetical protein